MNDLIPFDSLDQSLQVDVSDEVDWVNTLFSDAMEKRDPEIMFNYMVKINQQFQIQGIALARACYLMNKYWNSFEVGDNFLDTASDYLGLHRHTIERYIKVWEMLETAPKEISQELKQKNIQALIPAANALARGYEIEKETWDKIVDAPNYASISKIINEEVTHSEGRSNRLTILLDRSGSLWAISGEERIFIGSLEVEDEREIVKKAIERLTKNAGVMRQ